MFKAVITKQCYDDMIASSTALDDKIRLHRFNKKIEKGEIKIADEDTVGTMIGIRVVDNVR